MATAPFCNRCGNRNADDARFCSTCGANLAGQSAPEKPNVAPSTPAPNVAKRGPNYAAIVLGILAIIIVLGTGGLFGLRYLLITYVARTYTIPAGSMLPTLHIHNVILVDKTAYRGAEPKRGDIVVFNPPIPTPDDFIKRIVGMPGEKFEIRSGKVIVNGTSLPEPYIGDKPVYEMVVRDYGIFVSYGSGWQKLDPESSNIPRKSAWTAPDRLPANCYIMLGDNRNDSEDSHIWGCAQEADTFATGPRAGEPAHFTGRASRIIAPADRVRDL